MKTINEATKEKTQKEDDDKQEVASQREESQQDPPKSTLPKITPKVIRKAEKPDLKAMKVQEMLDNVKTTKTSSQ